MDVVEKSTKICFEKEDKDQLLYTPYKGGDKGLPRTQLRPHAWLVNFVGVLKDANWFN
jgi:hypothetical protein